MNERTDPAYRERLVASLPEPYAAAVRDARPDAAIAAKVARYAQRVRPEAERQVGRIAGSFIRNDDKADASAPKVDSAAGRLVADAQLASTRERGAQAAFMNPGGIRRNLECAAPPCTVTFGDAFAMLPFGNSLVVMDLTGEQLKALLELQYRASGEPYFLQPSAGFTYTWRSGAPRGERVSDMRLGGEPVAPGSRYRICVNSFLAEGAEGFTPLKEGASRAGGGQDIDALLAYLATAERAPVAEPRITRLP